MLKSHNEAEDILGKFTCHARSSQGAQTGYSTAADPLFSSFYFLVLVLCYLTELFSRHRDMQITCKSQIISQMFRRRGGRSRDDAVHSLSILAKELRAPTTAVARPLLLFLSIWVQLCG